MTAIALQAFAAGCFGAALSLCLSLALGNDFSAPPVRIKRRSGLKFLRLGRPQLSWCVCRA